MKAGEAKERSEVAVTGTMGKFRRCRFVHYERGSPLVVDVASLKAHLEAAERGRTKERKR